ncbi:MAG: flagellar hook-basal body complex protein FliE [Alphaproteobacteria bacterium]|nr:flagellar hook-basal body complex protein FliE [Alphaproteobacteria bacterium]
MIDTIQTATASSFTRQLGNIEESVGASIVPAPTPDVQSSDFSTVMSNVANDMVAAIQRGEQASMDGLNGQATTQEVVSAVMNAERTLQTALAVRDKIVTSYLEISRMAI